ncbi:MAG: MFS transporter, partial [Anaerolineales bacterium]|nr:MFS transporter [Anaerolineales bacterium]
MVSIFADNGLPAALAATVYVPLALTTAVVNLASGMVVNRFPIRIMLAISLLLQAVTLVMAQYLHSVTLAFVYGMILGMMMGLSRTVSTVIWAAYFGRRYLGSITGLVSTITIAGSALGPMPMGIARDLLGSYNLALNLFAIIPLVLAVAALFIKRPSKS